MDHGPIRTDKLARTDQVLHKIGRNALLDRTDPTEQDLTHVGPVLGPVFWPTWFLDRDQPYNIKRPIISYSSTFTTNRIRMLIGLFVKQRMHQITSRKQKTMTKEQSEA